MQLICSVALCSLLIAVTWAAGGDNQHVADNKEVPLKKLKLALGKDIQREREVIF